MTPAEKRVLKAAERWLVFMERYRECYVSQEMMLARAVAAMLRERAAKKEER